VSGATFDTGMLVAFDRNEREARVVLRRLVDRGEVATVPAVVIEVVDATTCQALPQACRGPQQHLCKSGA
jgi:uncharacterized protein with PIN domain